MLDLNSNNNDATNGSVHDLGNLYDSDQEQLDQTVLSIADLPETFFDNSNLKVYWT